MAWAACRPSPRSEMGGARVPFTVDSVRPSRADALALQGIPPGIPVSPRIAELFDEAVGAWAGLAAPVGLRGAISPGDLADLAGRTGLVPGHPVAGAFSASICAALFVFTLGDAVSEEVRRLFDRREFALGGMLDACASASVDAAARLAEDAFLGAAACDTPAGDVLARLYSPGYCGWGVVAQRELFRLLGPEEIGVSLGESCLMSPLKSVSGALVAAPRAVHDFRSTTDGCATCRSEECRHGVQKRLKGCVNQ